MALSSHAGDLLRKLIRGITWEPDGRSHQSYRDEGAISVHHQDGCTLIFDAEDLERLVALDRSLGRAALKDGGPRPKSVRKLVVSACFHAVEHGEQSALAWFEEELTSSPASWTVAEPIRAVFVGDELEVGQCRVLRSVDCLDVDPVLLDKDDFSNRVIVTEVTAFDRESADLVARERFEESRAFLSLVDRADLQLAAEPQIWISGENQGFQSRRAPNNIVQWNETNRIDEPGFAELNLALRRDEADRTDWEQRTAGAMRWLYRARIATSQAARASHLVAALDPLLAEDRHRRFRQIRERLESTLQLRLRGFDADQMAAWIDDRSADRHRALHAGLSVGNELEVERLHSVAEYCVRWACTHLIPGHAGSGRPCQTFREAHLCNPPEDETAAC